MAEDVRARVAKLNQDGLELLGEGKLVEALALFTAAIESDPNYAPSYLNRAESYSGLGREGDASRDRLTFNTLAAGGRFKPQLVEPSPTFVQTEPTSEAEASIPGESEAPVKETVLSGPEESDTQSDEIADPVISVLGPNDGETSYQDSGGSAPLAGAGVVIAPGAGGVALLVSPKRLVDPGPIYSNRLRKAMVRGIQDHLKTWTVERFLLSLFLTLAIGVVGVLIARVSFCPEGVTSQFWIGCGGETLGFGLGGGVLGFGLALLSSRFLIR